MSMEEERRVKDELQASGKMKSCQEYSLSYFAEISRCQSYFGGILYCIIKD